MNHGHCGVEENEKGNESVKMGVHCKREETQDAGCIRGYVEDITCSMGL